MTGPILEGNALRAVTARGSDLRIVACAGSGKTEVLAQRVAALISEGVSPESVVAFTFTEKAALELMERIGRRLEDIANPVYQIPNGLFVGTIHSFCLDLVKTRSSMYEAYDVLSELQLSTFVDRIARQIDLETATPGRSSRSARVTEFLRTIDVLENELIDLCLVREPLRTVISAYYDQLRLHNYLTFGLLIRKAIEILEEHGIAKETALPIQYLLVDEYQDVNPAQERLISLLSQQTDSTTVTIVGDDDQSIFQWRGADSSNLLDFPEHFPQTETIEITANRRSGPQIVELASRFVASIDERYPKELTCADPDSPSFVLGNHKFADARDEADWIAKQIARLVQDGASPNAIAVLCRSARVMKPITEALNSHGIPINTKGRGTLLLQPDCEFLVRLIAHLAEVPWRVELGAPKQDPPSLDDIIALAQIRYHANSDSLEHLKLILSGFVSRMNEDSRTVSIVDLLYSVLATLDVKVHSTNVAATHKWRYLASLLKVVADYEAVMRRSRRSTAGATQIGSANLRSRLIAGLAWHLFNQVGSLDVIDLDQPEECTVTVTTIHSAKGLEWPLVFIPSLTESAFPSPLVGRKEPWLLDRELFASSRYEGSLVDERRLMYVAATRAKRVLVLTSHRTARGKSVQRSRFYQEVEDLLSPSDSFPQFDTPELPSQPRDLSFTHFLDYIDCPKAYLLRDRLNLPSSIVPELGYGTAIHHLLRVVIDETKSRGTVPADDALDAIADQELFFPYATKTIAANMKEKALREFRGYLREYADEVRQATETEFPVSASFSEFRITGRADLIVQRQESFHLVDFKSAEMGSGAHLQLQVYALALRESDFPVKQAFVHNVSTGTRTSVDVERDTLDSVRAVILANLNRLANGDFPARPDLQRCGRCAAKSVCTDSVG